MLTRFDAQVGERARAIMSDCDQLLDDNARGFEIARELGVRADQLATIGTVPGTGGIDVDAIAQAWEGPPSLRRIIVWPKAYECPWSKSLPVLEALTLCWDRIPPCDVYMLAMQPETQLWFKTLPDHIKERCHVAERVPREQVLALMARARVMLAPSLVDGTPNSLLEAMAAGALPIVSPLETIRAIARDEENVLFARNLYPNEIASALERAMRDDLLVDRVAETNGTVVRGLADRAVIAPKVRAWYAQLASAKVAEPS
jgi:glycosyltransferase involved in cell wall biosynthesis